MYPEINHELCQDCLGCVDICQNEVIQEVDGRACVMGGHCLGCHDCAEQCTVGAITFDE